MTKKKNVLGYFFVHEPYLFLEAHSFLQLYSH